MDRLARGTIALAIIVLAAANAFACRRFTANDASLQNNLPFLTDDHPLHFANALATRHYLRESGANAGYDPFFMSGYAKSSIWPTNALLELVVFLTPAFDSAAVFKTFVWFSAAAVPLGLIYAGWRLNVSGGIVLLAVVLWIMQYWSGAPFHTYHYIQFGMSAFVWSTSLMLAAGAAFEYWLRTRTLSAALEFGMFAAFALMAHPTTAVLLGAPALLATLLRRETRTMKVAAQAMLAAVVAIGLNFWWIAPLVTLRGTFGESPSFFRNPNVWERLIELFRLWEAAPMLVAPSLMGLLLIVALVFGRRLGVVVPTTLVWLFLLAFPAGAIDRLAFLQVGRNTLHLNAWICLPAAVGVAELVSRRSRILRGAALLGLGWCLLCGAVGPVGNLVRLFTRELHATTAVLFPKHAVILKELRAAAPNARRALFEVFESRTLESSHGENPYGSVRLSPILPTETGLEIVGGPYLTTHYLTNFTNCGEGFFVGGRSWNRKDAEEYFRLYQLDLAVLWSRNALAFADANKDLFELVKDLRDVKIYRIHRKKSDWEAAGLTVSATYNQIVVENPRQARGTFVLPYHATPGWSVEPTCPLVSTLQADDPVPFLTLVDPPRRIVLRFSPWTLSGPPPAR